MKPIIRWTIGNVYTNGYTLLKYSISSFIQHYGNNYRFIVCYNNIEKEKLNVEDCVSFYHQKSTLFDGSGGLWKLTPPRLDKSVPELFVDNDIVFSRKNLKIIEFLEGDKFLICEDNYKTYGKYMDKMNEIGKYNTGIFGVPAGYEFEKELVENWKELGSFPYVGSLEEQGLISYTLSRHPHILIDTKECFLINAYLQTKDFCYNWSADMHHFIGANRNKIHWHFNQFNIKHL
jgi:hypothetical protein